jgi:predicted cation transporter
LLAGLLIILVLVLTLPFLVKKVEHNLEIFLFVMGLAATVVSGVLGKELIIEILENHFLYMITAAVLLAGLLFKYFKESVDNAVNKILKYLPLNVFLFLLVVLLGLLSSFITAIIASLVLVEVILALPLDRRNKVNLDIIACFSIGLGAVLTPVGEPLSTITVSKLNADFWYLFREVGWLIVPGVLALGLFGAFYVKGARLPAAEAAGGSPAGDGDLPGVLNAGPAGGDILPEDAAEFEISSPSLPQGVMKDVGEVEETYRDVFFRALKVFVFVLALELLGSGFKPVIDSYVVYLDSRLLYWINMVSAILDNATLAAAEISAKMTSAQIQAILMGLLISGGMLIPGNIPNIVSAGKLKIGSREWARLGVPLGLAIMVIYFLVLFLVIRI